MDTNQRIEEIFQQGLSDYFDSQLENLNMAFKYQKFGSPIEKLFYAAWYSMQWSYDDFCLTPQWKVEVGGKRLFLDFKVSAPFLTRFYIKEPHYTIGVEIDGHDYHERTKEQARKDKSRQRLLEKNNYRIIRFTGSEIFKDPMACTDEAYSFALQVTYENHCLADSKNSNQKIAS